MGKIQNIVIVGGEKGKPARFSTLIEPTKLNRNMGMAITSIFHGEIFNIHNGNNKITFIMNSDDQIVTSHEDQIPSDLLPQQILIGNITIPQGRYESVHSVLKAVVNAVKVRFNNKRGSPRLQVSSDKNNVITITITGMRIIVIDMIESPWDMVSVYEDILPESVIQTVDKTFDKCIEPAFLYASIVENSYINGNLSRNLGVIPLSRSSGWSFHEFSYPNYVPIDIKEFSNILLELRNMEGKYVTFDPKYKAVISLSIKPINTS